MMILKDILYKVTINAVVGNTNVSVSEINFDSRKVRNADLFVAIKGHIVDGHKFIDVAIKNGAIGIVCETLPENLVDGVTYVEVDNSNKALAIMASNFYENPSNSVLSAGALGLWQITYGIKAIQ